MTPHTPDRCRHVVIAGNIGVGKTTLVGLLADALGWSPIYELAGGHPYLDDYYADPLRWGFHSQIWFLGRRFRQHQQIAAMPGLVVQDRSIYEDAKVFVASLREQGILSARDLENYQQLYTALVAELPPPTLVIHLRARVETLMQRIERRSRPAERAIRPDYLTSLERHYAAWIGAWSESPILPIDTDEIDVIHDAAARRAVVELIAEHCAG